MFEVGDKIICINKEHYYVDLTIGNEYEVINKFSCSSLSDAMEYEMITDYGSKKSFQDNSVYAEFFITIEENRRRCILKLKENIWLKSVTK